MNIMVKSSVEIVRVSSCVLPEHSEYSRVPPRPELLRNSEYSEKFDYKTLAYDVFNSDVKLVFSGPPCYGLEDWLSQATFKLDDHQCTEQPYVKSLDRVQRNWISTDRKVKQLEWIYKDIVFKIDVNENLHQLFKDKNVLFTLSKNNKFEWILDWILFYKKIHGIDALLFYDNQSDNYTLEQLRDYLLAHELGIDIILVPWNYKYGPQGGITTGLAKAPWDSDFCQYGMMEHAKERFLKYAQGVVNVDIDELIVCDAGASIFSQLARNPALQIPGQWIESIPLEANQDDRFNNFFYYDQSHSKSDFKWCVNPQRLEDDIQWKVHTIKTKRLIQTKTAYYAHYKAINYNWKLKRTDRIQFNSKIHKLNRHLHKQLSRCFTTPDLPQTTSEQPSIWHKIITMFKGHRKTG